MKLLAILLVFSFQASALNAVYGEDLIRLLKQQNKILTEQVNEMKYANCLKRNAHDMLNHKLLLKARKCDKEHKKRKKELNDRNKKI